MLRRSHMECWALSTRQNTESVGWLPTLSGRSVKSTGEFSKQGFLNRKLYSVWCYGVIEKCWLHQDERKMFKIIQDRAYCSLCLWKFTLYVLFPCSNLMYHIKQHHQCSVLKVTILGKQKYIKLDISLKSHLFHSFCKLCTVLSLFLTFRSSRLWQWSLIC